MEDNLGMRSKASSMEQSFDFKGGIEQKDFGQTLHEPLTMENLEAAIRNLESRVPVKEKGKLFARSAVGLDQSNYPSGYYFGFMGLHPLSQSNTEDAADELYSVVLDEEEQAACQKLLVPEFEQPDTNEPPVHQLQNVDVVDRTKERAVEDDDDEILYIRDDGTKVYRQDRYDRERGTY